MKKIAVLSVVTLGAATALMLPGAEQPAKALASSCFTSSDLSATSSTYNSYTATQFANGLKGTSWVTPSSVTDQAEFNVTFNTSNLRFHTLGNLSVAASKTCNHTRWYQTSTDNKIQAFRLFDGETAEGSFASQNISGRVEAFTSITGWDGVPDPGYKYWWKGRYQISNAQQASLFQLKQNSSNDWTVMLRMDNLGNVYIRPRDSNNNNTRTKLVGNVIGKKFNLRVEEARRGTTFTVDWKMTVQIDGQSPVTVTGSRNFSNFQNNIMQFRWGVYQDGTSLTNASDGSVDASVGVKQPAKFARVRVAGAKWGRSRI